MIPTLKKTRKDSVVGLEIETGSIGAVEAEVNGKISVKATATCPISPGAFHDGEVTDPVSVASALKDLFSANKLSRKVRLGIANQRVVVRTLRLPAIENPEELAAAVRFAAQEQIAMPLDQAVMDHRVVGGVGAIDGAAPQVDVMVVAARRDMIAASLKPLREAGLEPVGVDLSAFGMIRALGSGVAEDAADTQAGASATLYCSVSDVTNLAVAKGRTCLFTRVAPAGLEDTVASLASVTGLPPEHARLWLDHVGLGRPLGEIEGDPDTVARTRTAMEQGAAALVDELRLSLDFYGAQEAAVPVEQIILCGPGSAIPGLVEHMVPALGMPIETGRPVALDGLDATSAARLTLPLGLALEQ
ncbi:MAG TPA: type IV pilus assembly protein PilM [Solirubrobacterales bacterium]|jgi:type IV pilus assembly protein PilM|nr:type IV pilus assembly protein PilM [Solirubrobacterales bacterium]